MATDKVSQVSLLTPSRSYSEASRVKWVPGSISEDVRSFDKILSLVEWMWYDLLTGLDLLQEYYTSSKLAKYPFEPYWPEKKLRICVTGAGGEKYSLCSCFVVLYVVESAGQLLTLSAFSMFHVLWPMLTRWYQSFSVWEEGLHSKVAGSSFACTYVAWMILVIHLQFGEDWAAHNFQSVSCMCDW